MSYIKDLLRLYFSVVLFDSKKWWSLYSLRVGETFNSDSFVFAFAFFVLSWKI